MAVTGGSATLVIAEAAGGERRVPLDAPFLLNRAETLSLRPPSGTAAFRSYVGVRGGLEVPAVLGSCATDVLSGLGPEALRAGDFLGVGHHEGVVGFPEPAPPMHRSPELAAGDTAGDPEVVAILRYLLGPRHDWFTPESLNRFEQQDWRVGTQSNRIGLRLEGAPLARASTSSGIELPSEGMLDGALQVPPSGLPVLFLADHPVTGGYPVLGVVLAEDLGMAAQLAPGARVRFRRGPQDGCWTTSHAATSSPMGALTGMRSAPG
ncbi:biotin-dependent carboxyltransferase family protein [Arthrobacter sp. LAPM80]|uniref:5-oxoprolinase subunit C family protein n=1 Tax=Arthrobacter sp. LAPM80 TaxID=3141788 RepID=UPI00398B3FE7